MEMPKDEVERIESRFSHLEECIKDGNNWSAKNAARVIREKIREYELPEDHKYWVRLRKIQSGYSFKII